MKKYLYKPYSAIFPNLFEKERDRIHAGLSVAHSIEHVGSTAVPGLGGKGIIDIAIAVRKVDMESALKELETLGYEYRSSFSTRDRFYFIIYLPDPEEETRRYHVHLTYPENTEWKELIGFRDYLRTHPQDALEYARIKEQAAKEADQNGEIYRKLKKPLCDKINTITHFEFSPAKPTQRILIHQWLAQDYIKEWIHGVGLQNTLTGLESFFTGTSSTTYWIGYDKATPFAFLITSFVDDETITLDLFICELRYLGKGFAVPMIHQFLHNEFPQIKRVLIDPEATNRRAIHVYQKAGFKIVGEFIASWHPVPHYQMELIKKTP